MITKPLITLALGALVAAVDGTAAEIRSAVPAMPMVAEVNQSAEHRWQSKPVLGSRLLEDMENLAHWSQRSLFGYVAPTTNLGEMTLTTERCQDGHHSLRLRAKTKGEKRAPQMGRPFGSTSVIRRFEGEDWSGFNRVSFWVYPDLPGFHTVSLMVALHNEGQIKLPGTARLGTHFLELKNQSWNHVVWEIPDLPRDKVTGLEFQYRLQGNEPKATDTVSYDFDHLELQKVDADYYEGWAVAPNRIAFAHLGYQTEAPKIAVASGLNATDFAVIEPGSGKTVFTRKVQTTTTPLGEYQVMDFSGLKQPGTYQLRAGQQTTPAFAIGSDIWSATLWKTVNYLYCQRCGDAIPGIHDVCHQDWLGIHEGKTNIINGGWHDAGDLSQGLWNTCEAIRAMLGLAERLRREGQSPELASRLIVEARWGLDWVLKNNFGNGYRLTWATHDFWTDGKIGNVDDVMFKAANEPRENFAAIATEAVAARVLRDAEPELAKRCLAMARADWEAVANTLKTSGDAPPDLSSAKGCPLELAGIGALASAELFQATGDQACADLAAKLAKVIVGCQQRGPLPGLKQPIAGFFYKSPAKKEIYQPDHQGYAHTPILALVALCRALPAHAERPEWYATVAAYSQYLQTTATFTEPYGVLPAALYRVEDFTQFSRAASRKTAGEATAEDYREQVRSGVDLGGGYYLRRFPVWFMRRGHFGVLLSQTRALAAAAQLCGDAKAAHLAERQLQWVVGLNPFAQSTMYGAGYDYVPHYSAMCGQMVGSLPVGIETLLNHDAPYWPVHNHMNPKETWVYPVAHWIALMTDLLPNHK